MKTNDRCPCKQFSDSFEHDVGQYSGPAQPFANLGGQMADDQAAAVNAAYATKEPTVSILGDGPAAKALREQMGLEPGDESQHPIDSLGPVPEDGQARLFHPAQVPEYYQGLTVMGHELSWSGRVPVSRHKPEGIELWESLRSGEKVLMWAQLVLKVVGSAQKPVEDDGEAIGVIDQRQVKVVLMKLPERFDSDTGLPLFANVSVLCFEGEHVGCEKLDCECDCHKSAEAGSE
jgi:hypothetical protein